MKRYLSYGGMVHNGETCGDPCVVYVGESDHAAAVARLREAGEKLDFYLHHDDQCPGIYERTCTCGLDEALAAWREAVKESV